jgi:hypothetical protein
MDALCPLVESSTDTAHDRLTLGAILRAFLPALLHLLKLGNHKVRVLWHLAACGTPALGANLSLVPPVRIDTGRRAPAETDIARVAWLPKAGNGWKNRHAVSYRSLTTIASSLCQQNLIPWC